MKHLSLPLILITSLLLMLACRPARQLGSEKTTTVTIRERNVPVTIDTVINIPGAEICDSADVLVDTTTGLPEMPEKTIQEGNLKATVSVTGGRLNLHVRQADTSIPVTVSADVPVTDSTVTVQEVITVEHTAPWYLELWRSFKNTIILFVIIAAIIIIAYVKLFR